MASIFTIAVSTLVFEIGLRSTDHRQRAFESSVTRTNERWVALTTAGIFETVSDSTRRYAMRPGASCEIEGWNFRTSSHRTRGADFPAQKPQNEKRLLCLGDSYAFGLWCDEEETLVGHLTRMANERERELGTGVSWRGVNLGVPGYHAGQQVRAFEQDGLDLDPDVVVWYFNTNDIENDGFFFDEELGVIYRDFLPLPVWLRRSLWNSHVYGWITTKHTKLVESGESPHLDPNVPYAFVREDNQEATRHAIARLVELCRERELPLFFVDQPHMTWMGDALNPDWNMLPLISWSESLRLELGLPGLNLLPWMQGQADGPDFLLDEFFSDPRAQAVLATARNRAEEEGRTWSELALRDKFPYFAGLEVPQEIDFHLLGSGYDSMARAIYPAMRTEGLLP